MSQKITAQKLGGQQFAALGRPRTKSGQFARVRCICGHTKQDHRRKDTSCSSCSCLKYQLNDGSRTATIAINTPAQPTPPPAPPAPETDRAVTITSAARFITEEIPPQAPSTIPPQAPSTIAASPPDETHPATIQPSEGDKPSALGLAEPTRGGDAPNFDDLKQAAPPPSEPRPAPPQYRGLAEMGFQIFTGTMGNLFDAAEWQPESEAEKNFVVEAVAKYLESQQITEPPPWAMALFAIGAYSVPRLGRPKTRAKLQTFFGKKQQATAPGTAPQTASPTQPPPREI